MAKKNLSSLMSGIMGKPEPLEETHNTNDERNSTASATPVESTEGKRKPGRPRALTSEIRATFIIDPDLVRKIKYITLVEGNLQKDIVDAALRQYIRKWESRNGEINLPDKR